MLGKNTVAVPAIRPPRGTPPRRRSAVAAHAAILVDPLLEAALPLGGRAS